MRIVSFILVLFVSLSCHQEIKRQDAPKDLIPEAKMTLIMKDLILIEGHIAISFKQIQSYHKILTASSEAIFKKHNVTKDRYERSFEYYASDQEHLTKLYSDVLNELTEEKGKLTVPETSP